MQSIFAGQNCMFSSPALSLGSFYRDVGDPSPYARWIYIFILHIEAARKIDMLQGLTNPIHDSQVQSQAEHSGREVNPLWNVA